MKKRTKSVFEFEAYHGLKFRINEIQRINSKVIEAYNLVLKPVFDKIDIGNARLWLFISPNKLIKIFYGYGANMNKQEYSTIHDFSKPDRDERMIELLTDKKHPELFDREYAERICEITGKTDLESIIAKVKNERLSGKITPEKFIGERKSHFVWCYKNLEPVQICSDSVSLRYAISNGIIYGDKNEHGMYIKSRVKRLEENFNEINRKIYGNNFARYFYTVLFPLYVSTGVKGKVLFGFLEADDSKKIKKNPTEPIPLNEMYKAFSIINKTLTPIILSNLIVGCDEYFLKEGLAKPINEVIDLADPYTAGHSNRVVDYSLRIAKGLEFSQQQQVKLEIAALLHDIGKIAISEDVLKKTSGLTDKEQEIIQKHVDYSKIILNAMNCITKTAPRIIDIIYSHHERPDGKGYPRRLNGDQIPIESKIIAVADAFDAMTSDRPYRRALSEKEAIRRLNKDAGTQFDLNVVNALSRLI